MTAPPLSEPLLTAAEAGALLRLSPKTVYRQARLGRVPCRVLWTGPRKALIRFVRSDLETWLGSRCLTRRVQPIEKTKR